MKRVGKILLKPRRLDVIFILALLPLCIMLLVSYEMKNKLLETNRLTAHTYEVLGTLDELQQRLLEAESSRRGYILTGNRHQRLQYLSEAGNLPGLLDRLRKLTADNPAQQQRLVKLKDLLHQKVENLGASVAAMDREGYKPLQQSQITEEGALLMSMIKAVNAGIDNEEQSLLKERRNVEQVTVSFVIVMIWGGILLAMTILSVAFFIARREAGQNQETADALEATNRDITNLSDMTQFLQSCASLAEAGKILSSYGSRFFSGDFGGLYLLNASRNLLVEAACWGKDHSEVFGPDHCWALRLGQPHTSTQPCDVKCDHAGRNGSRYVCIPLAAHHETLGVLYLGFESSSTSQDMEKKHKMATAFAEQVALAVRNLQLREQLRELSIRDPLTGLLNRRYMEESLTREISRAHRNKLSLAIVMMDVDHFKRFNDSFGHEAGDEVLRGFGHLLQKLIRGSDIACRFGGEEFTVILPEAGSEVAVKKADAIREAVKALELVSGKQALGRVTISAGVAVFPEDGDTVQQLLAVADAALYRAKGNGRDCVEYGLPKGNA